MATHIPFPAHLTSKDIELSDALHHVETQKQQASDLIQSSVSSAQEVLTQQMIKQLLALSVNTGCPVDPNTELVYFPEDGFIPQERYI